VPAASEAKEVAGLSERLAHLEHRLSLIESKLGIGLDHQPEQAQPEQPLPEISLEDAEHRQEELENRIGENWFPKVGISVLIIGFAFLLTFPYQGFPSALPSLFGYLLAAGAFALGHRWRNSLPLISRYAQGGALVLLYFTTLRLYFFSTDPPIADRNIELVALLLAVIVMMTISLRTHSQFQVVLSLTAGFIAALIGADVWVVIPLSLVLASATVYIAWKRGWLSLLLYGTVLTYLTHLLWVLNNPIFGNSITLLPFSPWHAIPLLLYAVIFAAGILFRERTGDENIIVIANSVVNVLGAGGLYLIITGLRNAEVLVTYHAATSALFLCVAILFWRKEGSRYSTFFYAMAGYMAMSVLLIAEFNRPDYFVWLAWQSLLVVSMAVWFRSRFIVIANFVIYVIILIAYAILADTVHLVSVSFGIVALASARILNWQKERLALKTELMRNAYLACAFFIFPFALYHALPTGYVSISWVVVALFYYAMSILLKSRKYRWMAFLTFLMTLGRVAFVDSVSLEPAYRVVSFLVLGTVLLLISLRYAKKKADLDPAAAHNDLHD